MALNGMIVPGPDRTFVRYGTLTRTNLVGARKRIPDETTRLVRSGTLSAENGHDQDSLRRVLEHYGIESQRAALAVMNELQLWEPIDIEPVLRQLTPQGRNQNPCGPKVNKPQILDKYVKAPLDLVRQSVDKQSALCVNRDGKFALKTSGYSVMSHVWEETIGQLDLGLRKKGIPKAHFLKFFDLCGATWLWVDVIAMPEIFEDMTPAEKTEIEAFRVDIINNLGSVYQQADKVIVLDILALQLSTGSLIDVAVILSLGRWIGRMWTVAESRLGQKVWIKTAGGAIDLDEIITLLEEEVMGSRHHRYSGLLETVSTMRRKPSSTALSELRSLVEAYRHAHTGDPVDQVRAAFPLLGLRWEFGWGQEEGMLHLIKQMPTDSAFLISLYGEREISGCYHAIPSALNQLSGHVQTKPQATITDTGVAGRWKTAVVSSIALRSNTGSHRDPKVAIIAVTGATTLEIEAQLLTDLAPTPLENAVEHGLLRLLFPEDGELFNFLLVCESRSEVSRGSRQTHFGGSVVGSGLCVLGGKNLILLDTQPSVWVLS
ncbi:putative monocarboxylate transporter [Colletotrichum sublineola]|uniref:Putative monocarboxylate transporter n=1 Tax=Colletotrichum sublineola TaxID=1173701 RepID=A0A066Y0Y8_COLSU|nr:putative monocarboxylate transporter [Colletotrichum sublineola]